MSVAGKNGGIGTDDLLATSRIAGIDVRQAREIIDEVAAAVERWREFADIAGVSEQQADAIAKQIASDSSGKGVVL
jgi:serine/threonine-protein kinase HipA